ncbi:MAG TPA: GNAT family protein [Rhizomicrobium sp.]|nr:GNAT family protein [Rhizomicrobium sp.]
MLVEAVDAHFAWMLGEVPAPFPGLKLPHDGVDSPGILRLLRQMTRRLNEAGCRGSWLIVAGNEVVGLCGYKQPPTDDGTVEIGYGIASGRRDRGYASGAVAEMLRLARLDPSIFVVTAATATSNVVSQRVLARNGFVQTGTSYDADDGTLIWWQAKLR